MVLCCLVGGSVYFLDEFRIAGYGLASLDCSEAVFIDFIQSLGTSVSLRVLKRHNECLIRGIMQELINVVPSSFCLALNKYSSIENICYCLMTLFLFIF